MVLLRLMPVTSAIGIIASAVVVSAKRITLRISPCPSPSDPLSSAMRTIMLSCSRENLRPCWAVAPTSMRATRRAIQAKSQITGRSAF